MKTGITASKAAPWDDKGFGEGCYGEPNCHNCWQKGEMESQSRRYFSLNMFGKSPRKKDTKTEEESERNNTMKNF